MMPRKLFLILTILLFCIGLCFGTESELTSAENKDVENAVSVLIDCISAGFVSEYSSTDISLPSTTVSMDYDLLLPRRISFLMADPADFVETMGKHVSNNGSVLGSIRALFNKTSEDPYLSAAYLSMASKGYEPSDYLLSGSVVFSYSQGTDIDKIENLWLSRDPSGEHLMFNANITFYGLKLERSLTLNGWFELYVDSNGLIHAETFGPVKINDKETDKLEFQL